LFQPSIGIATECAGTAMISACVQLQPLTYDKRSCSGEIVVAEYQALIQTIALLMGVAWASGINLYAAVGMLGLGGALGYIELPPSLAVLQDPMVILAAGFMYCVEFMTDKMPGVDTGWDALHTFIRIPAGAVLAAGSVGDVTPAIAISAGLLGGGISAASHAAKAGSRVLINTSPEPFSNWAASLTEDAAVFAGLWLALTNPVVFLAVFCIFLVLLCWFLPKIWRGVRAVFRRLGVWLGLTTDRGQRDLRELQRLAAAGVLTDTELQAAQARVAPR
jgi:hypothetical protein